MGFFGDKGAALISLDNAESKTSKSHGTGLKHGSSGNWTIELIAVHGYR